MPRDPERTRTDIMDAAEALIFDHGFAGASVSAIIDEAGVTKGAFFHHFDTKNALARALVERFATADRALLDGAVERARRYSRDPVQRVLILVSLLEEYVEGRPGDEPPGCLYASYCYQAELFDQATLEVARRAMRSWRERVGEMLAEAVEAEPPRVPVEVDDLADMLTVIFEGAYVMSRTLHEPGSVGRQLRQYRQYLELLFGREAREGGGAA